MAKRSGPSKNHRSATQRASQRPDTQRHARARRRLLQSIAASGAAVSVKSLPEQWARPVLDASILPAHAQATCQVESLACRVNGIDYSWGGETGTVRYTDQAPPLDGGDETTIDRLFINLGTCTGTYGGVLTGATLDVSASIAPSCGTVELSATIPESDAYSVTAGGDQSGVVDPDTGAVSFNNVVVGVSLPTPSGGGNASATGVLDLTFRTTPGVDPCTINITFTEQVGFNC